MSQTEEAAQSLLSTEALLGVKVYGGKNGTRKIGKIHNFVFHPSEKRLIGVLVKRPDAALMFHRKDLFVRLGAWSAGENGFVVGESPDATDSGACKALNVDWDRCVLWWGLPVVSDEGESLGTVGSVVFDAKTGQVDSFELEGGLSESVLLGTSHIPSSMIRGFKQGIGSPLVQQKSRSSVEDISELGAVMVSAEAKTLGTQGGLAEKAGTSTAEAAVKIRRKVVRVKPKVKDAADRAKEAATPVAQQAKAKAEEALGVSIPTVQEAKDAAAPKLQEAKETAGEAAEKGLFAAGRQIGRATTMFSSFKEEYERARDGE